MHITYRPKGVCSRIMEIEYDEGKIQNVQIIGGCDGNLQGISSLLRGMDIEDAIEKLQGIRCGFKNTSCPDQLAQALKNCIKN